MRTATGFKKNPIMTLREMNQIRRSFRIFLSRPPGGKWLARMGVFEITADAPWLAVVGVLEGIGTDPLMARLQPALEQLTDEAKLAALAAANSTP